MKSCVPNPLKSLVILAVSALLISCKGGEQKAMGTLEWDRVNGRAVASEVIAALHVREGDEVTSGQPLLQLDPALQQTKVKQTEARIEQLQWRLSELVSGYRSEEIAAAQAEYDAAVSTTRNREVEYARQQRLVVDNLTSERAVDLARTQLDQARGQEESTHEYLLQLQAGYRTEQVNAARAELDAEQEKLAYEQQLLDRYTVTAERDGFLESFPFKLGDKPPAGAVVSTVLSGEAPWARVYLPQPWLNRAPVGTLVDVYVDGRDSPFEGRIRHIESRPSFTPYYALAEEDRQRLTYVTQIDMLSEDAAELPVGIPVQVALRD